MDTLQVSGGVTLGLPMLFILFVVILAAVYAIYQYYFCVTNDRAVNRYLFPDTEDSMSKKELREVIKKYLIDPSKAESTEVEEEVAWEDL